MLIDLEPQHIALFKILYDAGVFQLRNGSADIHFNNDGNIAAIELHQKVYRRVVDKVALTIQAGV